MKKLILVLLMLPLMACEECELNETRCKGNVVEICNSNGKWKTLMDCDDIFSLNDDEWECCRDGEGYNCMLEEECNGGDS